MAELDTANVERHFGNLFAKVEGAFSIVLGHLGDRLGLYAALAESGGSTPEQLAAATRLKERWVREWLQQQTAAGVLTHAGGVFS